MTIESSLPPDIVGKGIFSGCPSAASVCLFVCLSGHTLLPRYLMNGSINLDEIYSEYSLAHTDDLMRFRHSRGQMSRSHQAVEVAKALTSTPVEVLLVIGLKSLYCNCSMG